MLTFFHICGNLEVKYRVVHNHANMRPRMRSVDGYVSGVSSGGRSWEGPSESRNRECSDVVVGMVRTSGMMTGRLGVDIDGARADKTSPMSVRLPAKPSIIFPFNAPILNSAQAARNTMPAPRRLAPMEPVLGLSVTSASSPTFSPVSRCNGRPRTSVSIGESVVVICKAGRKVLRDITGVRLELPPRFA